MIARVKNRRIGRSIYVQLSLRPSSWTTLDVLSSKLCSISLFFFCLKQKNKLLKNKQHKTSTKPKNKKPLLQLNLCWVGSSSAPYPPRILSYDIALCFYVFMEETGSVGLILSFQQVECLHSAKIVFTRNFI